MKALILASGYGTRLGALTKDKPKPMVTLAERPVIDHILFWLSHNNVTDVMVTVSYKYDKLVEYLGDRVTYLYEPTLEGADAAVRKAWPWFKDEPMIVQNGDTLTDLDLQGLLMMSRGKNVRFMDFTDKSIFAGTKIILPEVGPDGLYRDVSVACDWLDMGTPTGLKKAQKLYEGK